MWCLVFCKGKLMYFIKKINFSEGRSGRNYINGDLAVTKEAALHFV